MHKLGRFLEGWDGYQTSLMRAMTPLTGEQLSWRLAPERRSVGELVRHLSLGRIAWLARMGAPGVDAVVRQIPRWYTDADGARHVVEEAVPCDQPAVLAEWLALSWLPIQRLLDEWTVDHLFQSYPHRFRGVDYLVSRQWTLWRGDVPRSPPWRTDRHYARGTKCGRLRIESAWRSHHSSSDG